MKESEEKIQAHNGCPYRHTCKKDETKCCYLVSNRCIINEYEDNYIFKERRKEL